MGTLNSAEKSQLKETKHRLQTNKLEPVTELEQIRTLS